MVSYMRSSPTLLLAMALALAVLASSVGAQAEEPGPAALSPPAADAPELAHFEYWRARADAARASVAAAKTELDTANGAVRRMRRDNHPRGEARRPLLDEQARAQAVYDEAVQALEVQLPAEARTAGAQQSWLRERR